jgi:hypothetical protein
MVTATENDPDAPPGSVRPDERPEGVDGSTPPGDVIPPGGGAKEPPPNLWHLVMTGFAIAAGAALFGAIHKWAKRRLR